MADRLLGAQSSAGGAGQPAALPVRRKVQGKVTRRIERSRYNPVCMKAEAVEGVLHCELLSPGPQRAFFKGARVQTPVAAGSLRGRAAVGEGNAAGPRSPPSLPGHRAGLCPPGPQRCRPAPCASPRSGATRGIGRAGAGAVPRRRPGPRPARALQGGG